METRPAWRDGCRSRLAGTVGLAAIASVVLLLAAAAAVAPARTGHRTAGAAPGSLVAIQGVFDAQTGDRLSRRLVRIDLATAAPTPIGPEIPGLAFFLNGESTFDAVGRRLFLIGLDDADVDRLYTIDADTGAVIASPAMPAPQAGTQVSLNAFEFDRLGGALLAVRGIFDTQTQMRVSRRLVRIDPATGAQTPVGGEIPGLRFFVTGENTFDDAGRRLFLMGEDDGAVRRLYVIDAETGAVIASPAVPAPPAGTTVTLDAFEFDRLGGSLLAMRGIFDASTGARLSRRLVQVDPTSLAQTPVGGEIAGQAGFTNFENTFDAAGRRLFFTGLDDADTHRLYVVDAQAGALVGSPALASPAPGTDVFFNAFEFDGLGDPVVTPAPPPPPPPPPATGTTAPSTGAGPAASASTVVPALAELRRALGADARAAAGILRRLGIGGLLDRGGFTLHGFDALTAGTLGVTLTARTATPSAARKVTLAKARRSFARPGRYRVTVTLTRKGRRLLRRSRTATASLRLSFSDAHGRSAGRSAKVKLGR